MKGRRAREGTNGSQWRTNIVGRARKISFRRYPRKRTERLLALCICNIVCMYIPPIWRILPKEGSSRQLLRQTERSRSPRGLCSTRLVFAEKTYRKKVENARRPSKCQPVAAPTTTAAAAALNAAGRKPSTFPAFSSALWRFLLVDPTPHAGVMAWASHSLASMPTNLIHLSHPASFRRRP